MRFSVTTLLAALLCLCAPASCAPTAGYGLQHACSKLRQGFLNLNDKAKNFSAQARNETTEESGFEFTLPWMEANDQCDPENLNKSSSRCMGKILGVLGSYMTIVHKLSYIENCSDFACEMLPLMVTLQNDLSQCVKSKGATADVKEFNMTEVENQDIDMWQQVPLCSYVKERVFSFSILTARVFGAGDPALHATQQRSADKCM